MLGGASTGLVVQMTCLRRQARSALKLKLARPFETQVMMWYEGVWSLRTKAHKPSVHSRYLCRMPVMQQSILKCNNDIS